jgi:putative inorganic carbon (HCO3(-)) transporter
VFNVVVIALYLLVYFIRPAEWIPWLYFNWQLYVGVIALFIIAYSAITKKDQDRYADDKSNLYLLGFIIIAMFSSVANGWVGGAYQFLLKFMPSIVGYYLVTYGTKTKSQWEFIVGLLIFCLMFISWQAYLEISTGSAVGGLQPYMRVINEDSVNETSVPQAIWYGVFRDPNDLGMALTMFVPYLLNKLLEKKFIYFLPLGLIINAIYLTNSRGTIVALIVGLGMYFLLRKRSYKGLLIAGLLAVLVLAVGPARVAQLNTSEESAAGRFDAWYEAIYLFRHNPFFGVGVDNFQEYHEITAHNSYMLVLAETGFFGLVCFLALLVIPIYASVRIIFSKDLTPELLSLASVTAGVISMCFSIMFISRPYVMLPYLYTALLATYLRINYPEEFLGYARQLTFKRAIGIAVLFIVLIFFVLKLFL